MPPKPRYQRKKPLSVQLPCAAVTPAMAEQVRHFADEREVSQSEVIRMALRVFFSKKNSKSINSLIVQES